MKVRFIRKNYVPNWQLKHFYHFLINRIYRYPIIFTVCVSMFLIGICSWVIANEKNISFFDALIGVFVLFLGELGEINGNNVIKIASAVSLLSGVFIVAIIGAKIVTGFIDLELRGGKVMKKVKYTNHIIICGWNHQGRNIIEQLLSTDMKERTPVVILANLEKKPIADDRVDFISGDPTKKSDLLRAGIMTAKTAIVLTEIDSKNNSNIVPDAQAVLITLAVESLRRDVYTCVQLLNSEYKEHLERVHVDEYISLDHLGANLVAASALNHGLSWIITHLLTFNKGSEFYRVNVPKAMVGKQFKDVATFLLNKRIIPVAVETDEKYLSEEMKNELQNLGMLKDETAWIVNPPVNYILKEGDSLFIIAEEEPAKGEIANWNCK